MAELHFAHAKVRAPPAEIVEIIIALNRQGLIMGPMEVESPVEPERTGSEEPRKAVPLEVTLTARPLPWNPMTPTEVARLHSKIKVIPTRTVETWVRAHPKGTTREFAAEFIKEEIGFSGPKNRVYTSAYNKVARVRRKLGLPPPSKVEG
ncbi:MAG: hypothetical protein WAN74_06495 [Thermoplasmata archaeon]